LYDNFLVRSDSLQNVEKDGKIVGFKFAVRVANYRGLFVSLASGFYVNMDGVEYPEDALTLEINGKPPRTLAELAKSTWEFWNYQDEHVYLNVAKEGGLAPGKHRLGYLPVTMNDYGYHLHDKEWIKNPPKPGMGGGKTSRVCWFDLDLQ